MSSQPTEGIRAKVIRGTSFLVFGQMCAKIISFMGHIFLARLLMPTDFGVYAVAAFIVTFSISMFTNGLPSALLQKREEITQSEINDFFTLQQLIALLLYALIWISAPAISDYYHNQTITPAFVRVFCLVIVVVSVRAFPYILLERQLNYKQLAIFDFLETLLFHTSTVFLAFKGFGAWSFAWGMLFSRGMVMILAWIVAGRDLRFSFRWFLAQKTVLFGFFIQLGNIFGLLRDSIIPVVIGRTLGMQSAGFLNWAWLLATYPMFVAQIFERTSYSALSRVQDKPESFAKAVENFFFLNNIIVPGLMTVIASQAHGIVHFVFTDKWDPAIPIVYLFSVYVIVFPSGNIAINAINALGKSRFTFLVSAWFFCFYLVATFVFTHFTGLEGYGWVVAIGSFNYLIYYWYLKRQIPVRLGRASFEPILASAIAGGIGYWLSQHWLAPTVGNFVLSLFVTGLLYCAIILLFFHRQLKPLVQDVLRHILPAT